MTPRPDFDRTITAWLDERTPPRAPDDLLAETLALSARTRPRPAWLLPERWIPMRIRVQLAVVPRAVLIVATLIIISAFLAAAVTVGASLLPKKLPPPTGLAANGSIAYASAGDIYLAQPDGTGSHAITTGPASDFAPQWSPDGTRLAFWSALTPKGPTQLVVVAADGTGAMTVAESPDMAVAIFNSWSPDGSEIAYSAHIPGLGKDPCPVSGDSGGMCGFRIFAASSDGTGHRQLGDPVLDARNPAYSPDGSTIAFGGGDAGSGGLYLMDADGSNARQVGNIAGGGWGFVHQSWSPDGTQVVTQDGNGYPEIWVVKADGSGAANISNDPSDELIPSYSPDGTAISYGRSNAGAVIWTKDSGPRLLPLRGVEAPVWSPDGTALVAADATGAKLLIFDRTGTTLAKIDAPGLDGYPSWQRVAQ